MKTKVTLITVFVLALMILVLQTNPAKGQVVTDGLISYWTFDKADIEGDTAKDVWGKNNGKISGAKIAKGLVGDALEFDGADDYVNVTEFNYTDYAELRAEARFKVNQTNSNSICTQNQGPTGGGDFFNIYTSDNILRFGLRADDNSTWHQAQTPFTDTKKWHHFIAVYDGKKSVLYLDGASVAESGEFKICKDAEALVRIGSRAGDFGRPLDGLIDEVLMYNRALNEDEVKQNFNSEGLAVSPKKKLAITWGEIKVSR